MWKILLWLCVAGVLEAEPRLDIKAFPASVDLEPWGEPSQLMLVVRNPGPVAVSNLKLSEFTDIYLDVTQKNQAVKAIKPGQDAAFVFILRPTSSEIAAGNVYFRFNYDGAQISTVAVPVKIRGGAKAEDILKVNLQTTLATLYEYQSGKVDVQITNQSADELAASVWPVDYPTFIQFQPWNRRVTLHPFATSIVQFEVTTAGKLLMGKQLLLFEVDFAPAGEGGFHKRSVVVSKEVDVGVVGESDLLKLLGVPSFLFLPGCLAIWAAYILWKIKLFKPEMGFDLTFPKPEFLVVSVTLSMLLGVLYWIIRGVNILRGYDFADLVLVWILSIAVGGLSYSGYAGWKDYQRRRHEKLQAGLKAAVIARTPSGGDTPIALLKKLSLQKLGLVRTRVEFKGKTWFIVEPDLGQDALWMARRIQCEWHDDATSDSRRKVSDLLDSNGDPGQLADVLQAASPELDLRWEGTEPPTQAARDALTPRGEAKILAQTE
jgi:hypothetical protein